MIRVGLRWIGHSPGIGIPVLAEWDSCLSTILEDSDQFGQAVGVRLDEYRARTLVIVPAYNEGSRLGTVLEQLKRSYENVVVVDDGSSDETGIVARRAGAVLIRHLINRGQGASLQTGLEFGLLGPYEYFVTFDADGQHRVTDIDRLLMAAREKDVDVVLGSRFLERGAEVPALRMITLKSAVVFTRAVSGLDVTDAHNGLRLLTRKAAGSIELRHDRMAHASELIDQIRIHGLSYVEVPVRISYSEYSRGKGQSNLAALNILFDYLIGRWFR